MSVQSEGLVKKSLTMPLDRFQDEDPILEEMVEALQSCFRLLQESGYYQPPVTPEMRKRAQSRGSQEQSPIDSRESQKIDRQFNRLRPFMNHYPVAVSSVQQFYVAHAHWKDEHGPSAPTVYLGYESLLLANKARSYLNESGWLYQGTGKALRGLDLGSGAGGVSLALADTVGSLVGIEQSALAVRWSQANARSQNQSHLQFCQGELGTPTGRVLLQRLVAQGGAFDFAMANPPMVLTETSTIRPYRDGGLLGIERPLIFLDAAADALRNGGRCLMLMTSPRVIGPRSDVIYPLFNHFKSRPFLKTWRVLRTEVVEPHFNQVYYSETGQFTERAGIGRITNVELLFVVLEKT